MESLDVAAATLEDNLRDKQVSWLGWHTCMGPNALPSTS